MTIEEIKEWRQSGVGLPSGYAGIIDTLIDEIERCHNENLRSHVYSLEQKLTTATEALRRIAKMSLSVMAPAMYMQDIAAKSLKEVEG